MSICRSLLIMLGILFVPIGIVSLRAAEPVPYGTPIDLVTAKKVMAAAEAEAKKNSWSVVIAIVDGGGHLVMLERLDNTQWGSVEIAQRKALTAAKFRRPTRFWEERIAKGGVDLKLLKINGFPMEGGLPIIHQGKVIGAIGVSGVTSTQDAQIGRAGIAAIGNRSS
ncbi:MAG: heme-binding protein [Pirellulales bacterium]|nr:heme-binding protein [Pirellulales bacterium]